MSSPTEARLLAACRRMQHVLENLVRQGLLDASNPDLQMLKELIKEATPSGLPADLRTDTLVPGETTEAD